MLLWCEALERLGLGKYGYGYTGKGGATMERFLRMPFDLGYPRIDIPGGMPAYTIVQMGDTPGSLHAMNGLGDGDAIVTGYLPDGQTGGLSWFGGGRMNGPLPKFMAPMWWELGHRRSPQAGFDYFLAQMRQPGQDLYLPSLYWGLGPIDPKQVRPPAPATSYVAMERGFAFLRADETAAYWEGPGPAVALQFGMYYVHYAHDGFSILGYHALNRTLYTHAWGGQGGTVNESIKAHPRGYIGGHPWHDTVRGYAGVVVDNLKALPIAGGDHGLQHHRLRQDFAPAVKFVAGRVKPTEVTDSRWVFNEEKDEMETVSEKTVRGLYPGVDLERALFLTDEYLLDVFWLSSDRPRRYDWAVHGAGSHRLDAARGWAPTSELNGSMLYRDAGEAQPEGYADQRDGNDLLDVHKMDPGDAAWTGVIVQDGPHGDPKRCRLPPEWFARGVGVRVSMLGEAGTTVFAGRPPQGTGGPVADALRDYAALGGATLLVRRTVPATAFVALHEPFEGGEAKAPATALERIGQDAGGVAVRILGKAGALNDRACLRYGEEVEGPLTLSGGGERFTFADHAFVRIGRDTVEAVGDLRAMKLKVEGRPRLRLNGKDVPARVAGGYLEYGP
jgi:hypothetical protein